MITVRIDTPEGVTFSASYDHDGQLAGGWLLTGFSGWAGGVGVRAEEVPRLRHGSFPAETSRGTRTITVDILVEEDSREALWRTERALSGIFSDGGYGSITVTADGDETMTSVRLDGEVKLLVNLDAGHLTVQVPLFAPDPFIYGPWRETSLQPVGSGVGLEYPVLSEDLGKGPIVTFGTELTHSEPIWNDGNAISYPQFTVTADAPGGFAVSIAGTGRRVTYPWPTFADMPVVVDMAGAVLVSGSDQSHLVGERGWAEVAPGSMGVPRFELLSGGTGFAVVRHRDTSL